MQWRPNGLNKTRETVKQFCIMTKLYITRQKLLKTIWQRWHEKCYLIYCVIQILLIRSRACFDPWCMVWLTSSFNHTKKYRIGLIGVLLQKWRVHLTQNLYSDGEIVKSSGQQWKIPLNYLKSIVPGLDPKFSRKWAKTNYKPCISEIPHSNFLMPSSWSLQGLVTSFKLYLKRSFNYWWDATLQCFAS